MNKSLDQKLAEIRANPHTSKAFIIADAKDADMAFGAAAPGPKAGQSPEAYAKGEAHFKSLEEYRQQIREVIKQGLVDILLASASNIEQLAMKEGLFRNSHITPAARANDTTDIWVVRGSQYIKQPSQPFRTASIDHIQCGKIECGEEEVTGANLGLYSVTFTNDVDRDKYSLCAFKTFREEAERKAFKYFLEVFDPNIDAGVSDEKLGSFINDHIIRSLAGVTSAGRPQFLKIVYHGPKAMEELVSYDPQLVAGILGGGAGTTYDAFKLIAEAQKYGARVALFGRKINMAEHQLAFIQFLRLIVDGQITPEEAVKAYHGVLQGMGIKPHRNLQDDMQLQTGVMSYGGGGSTVTVAKPAGSSAAAQIAPARTIPEKVPVQIAQGKSKIAGNLGGNIVAAPKQNTAQIAQDREKNTAKVQEQLARLKKLLGE
ncbi:hypothetical protein QPK87_07590 [Kamptonema cortianum]|nr:hypothetical protein [Oscillatoria laete-virens]MDK3156438.1 hypothetical protein [Kamptonema cortianum]MDL5046297.1 hypothetical protein [Oscillatoria amoena NRMC-F 0135]MDL5053881.1 hypothetical protein [Oscillatoria laete-virens NRMC-F 0139]